jgi:hypothetical protein
VVVVVVVMVVEVSSGKVVELCGGEGPGGQHERGCSQGRDETRFGPSHSPRASAELVRTDGITRGDYDDYDDYSYFT